VAFIKLWKKCLNSEGTMVLTIDSDMPEKKGIFSEGLGMVHCNGVGICGGVQFGSWF